MLKRLEWSRKIYNGLLGIVAVLGVIIPLFTPRIRHWMHTHSSIGWAAAIVLPTAVFVVMDFLRSAQHSNSSKTRDYALIMERLGDWSLNSPFYEYLHSRGTHTIFSTMIADDIENQCANWEMDSRGIKNKNLRTAFDNTKEAANIYNTAIGDLMFTREIGTGPSRRLDEDHLVLSPELKHSDPPRFYEMNTELQAKRMALDNALAHLFRVLHDARPMS